jgi:hypothetical protein
MDRSGSANDGRQGPIPRWVVLSPLLVSFLSLAASLFPAWCEPASSLVCTRAANVISWIGTGFPHEMAFPLLMTPMSPLVVAASLAGADLLILACALRSLPRRMTAPTAAAVIAGWVGVTVAMAYAMPFLMVWTYGATH